jgi:hypothetical protein
MRILADATPSKKGVSEGALVFFEVQVRKFCYFPPLSGG